MPVPNNTEDRETFIERCMADEESNADFPDNDQRYAFCNSQWENKDKNNVMKTGYKNKVSNLAVKEIDIDTRIVKGYFASFNNVDSDGDSIMKGAFNKSIKEHGAESTSNRKISHLAFHDVTRPVGVIKVLKEDDKGLYFESELGTHDEGNNALKMYKDGIIREHSIGFNYIADKTQFIEVNKDDTDNDLIKNVGGYWKLHEVKLWEGSFVTFGANSETPNLSAIKSKQDIDNELDQLKQRMEIFVKALKDGNYSEKYNQLFEVELLQIQKSYESLITFEPFIKTLEQNKTDEDGTDHQKLMIELLKTIKI